MDRRTFLELLGKGGVATGMHILINGCAKPYFLMTKEEKAINKLMKSDIVVSEGIGNMSYKTPVDAEYQMCRLASTSVKEEAWVAIINKAKQRHLYIDIGYLQDMGSAAISTLLIGETAKIIEKERRENPGNTLYMSMYHIHPDFGLSIEAYNRGFVLESMTDEQFKVLAGPSVSDGRADKTVNEMVSAIDPTGVRVTKAPSKIVTSRGIIEYSTNQKLYNQLKYQGEAKVERDLSWLITLALKETYGSRSIKKGYASRGIDIKYLF